MVAAYKRQLGSHKYIKPNESDLHQKRLFVQTWAESSRNANGPRVLQSAVLNISNIN